MELKIGNYYYRVYQSSLPKKLVKITNITDKSVIYQQVCRRNNFHSSCKKKYFYEVMVEAKECNTRLWRLLNE